MAFIDSYYNRVRLHSSLGYKPPAEFEQDANAATISEGATLSVFRHKEIYRSDVGSNIEGEMFERNGEEALAYARRFVLSGRRFYDMGKAFGTKTIVRF